MSPDWTITRTSNPSGLAVSLEEAKAHLRVSGTSQDDHITILIQASTERLERDINRAVLQCQWQQSLKSFPSSNSDPIKLFMGGATTVSSITYTDEDGLAQTLSVDDYSYSQPRNVVFCESTDGWPVVDTTTASDKVFINFTAGATDGDCVPRLFKQAILLETGRAYFDPAQENTVNTNDGRSYEAIVRKLVRSSYP